MGFIHYIDVMLRKGDIFKYTATVGGGQKYYVDTVYKNICGEWMVITSWEDVGLDTWLRTCEPLSMYLGVLQSGHIRLVGSDDHKPLTSVRPHSFNPKLRNIPIEVGTFKCPYRTPKLYTW